MNIRDRSLRRLVFERDGGVCRECGRSCSDLRNELILLFLEVKAGSAEPSLYLATLADLGVVNPTVTYPPTLWEADHVIPLFLGGSDSLSNLQTLCRTHHLLKTIAEAA